MDMKKENKAGWFRACRPEEVPPGGGACVKYGARQIALFHFAHLNRWFATDNRCPHRGQMALSRGMIGESAGEPKVACPFHKKTFSLDTGSCLSDPGAFVIRTYPVKTEGGYVWIHASAEAEETDRSLAELCADATGS